MHTHDVLGRLVPSHIRHNFRCDFVSAVLVGVFTATVVNFVPVLTRRLGGNAFEVALVVAMPLAANLMAPFGLYIPHRWRLQGTALTWILGRGVFLFIVFISTASPVVLLVGVFYVVVSLSPPNYLAVMRAVYPPQLRGRAMGYVRVGMTAALIVATPLAGRMMDTLGYPLTFVCGALFGIASGVAFLRMRVDPAATGRPSFRRSLGILKRDGNFALYSSALMIVGTGYMLAAPLFTIFQVDRLQLSYSQIGLLNFLNSVVWMLSYVLFGRLVDRRGPVWVVQVSLLLQAMLPLCYFLAADIKLVALAFALSGMVIAAGDLGVMNVIMAFAGPDQVPDYAALHGFLAGLRGIAGSLLGAALVSIPAIGMEGVFVLSFVLQLGGWLVALRVHNTYPLPAPGV
ncbi:MAG: MFS transporter [Anaerolineales bacterium]|nr:MFS transporter [Anaerolineales bacterium]